MDARNYDRYADLLAQILWNLNAMPKHQDREAEIQRQRYIRYLVAALECNDLLGKWTGQGLI